MPLARGRDPICAQCPSSRNQLPSGPPICGQGGCNHSIHSRLVFRLWYQQSHARIEVIHSEKGGASVWLRWRPGFGNFSGLMRGTRPPNSMVVGLWGLARRQCIRGISNSIILLPVQSRAARWRAGFAGISSSAPTGSSTLSICQFGTESLFVKAVFLSANLVKQTHHCHQYSTNSFWLLDPLLLLRHKWFPHNMKDKLDSETTRPQLRRVHWMEPDGQ